MKRFKNLQASADTWTGQEVAAGAYYTIQESELVRWANDPKVISDLTSDPKKALMNDGTTDFTDPVESLNFLRDSLPKLVMTQFERTDLFLKLAKFGGPVVSGEVSIQIPIPAGGRYLSGGWGLVDTFNMDDYALVSLVDQDRIIAGLMGGLTDEQMQGEGTYPNYPEIMSFNDDELPEANRGWYFYPAGGGTMGEVEFEPLGGYALLPEGMYLQVKVVRPNVSTGKVRGALFWGNKV